MLNNALLDKVLSLSYIDRYDFILNLADDKDPEIYQIILYLIEIEEKKKGNYGTLIYALRNYPPEPLFLKAINWLATGNFEVAHEAFYIINNINKLNGNDVDYAYSFLEKRILEDIEDWRKELLNETLEMFS